MRLGCTTPTSFKCPPNRLLPLQGIIEEDELYSPQTFDMDGKRCLPVIKNGFNGVTIGRATGIKSVVSSSPDNRSKKPSMEWAILQYDSRSGPFSDSGDSGAIIVDGKGRIGGLLTSGTCGSESRPDVTYATPFYWILQRTSGNKNSYI